MSYDDEKFLQRFRTDSVRLKNWNYDSSGYYFVTICIRNKKPYFFGNIENGNVILNNIGKTINKYWLKIPEHFNNVKLDEFILMPDHLHGIIKICRGECVGICSGVICRDTIYRVSTNNRQYNKFGPLKPGSLPVIIGNYKAVCTRKLKEQNKIGISIWQKKYYDHIIKNKKELNNIRKYIQNNPMKWQKNRHNPKNIWY